MSYNDTCHCGASLDDHRVWPYGCGHFRPLSDRDDDACAEPNQVGKNEGAAMPTAEETAAALATIRGALAALQALVDSADGCERCYEYVPAAVAAIPAIEADLTGPKVTDTDEQMTAALSAIRSAVEWSVGMHRSRALTALPILERALAEGQQWKAEAERTLALLGKFEHLEANALAPGVGLRPAADIAHEVVKQHGRCLHDSAPGNVHGVLCKALTAAIGSDRQSRPAGRRGPLRLDEELRRICAPFVNYPKPLNYALDMMLDRIETYLASGAAPGKEPSR
jgi:hypothetical protein